MIRLCTPCLKAIDQEAQQLAEWLDKTSTQRREKGAK